MGFFVEDSCLLVTHALYQAAVVLAVMRWALSWFRNRTHLADNDSSQYHPSSHKIRERLVLTTFGDIKDRSCVAVTDTCAVCLAQFRGSDEVRELRNCCHVFHRECIDRWVEHDHKTCPLCRSPLLTTSQCLEDWSYRSQPSWAVERILYLFGDDLYT